LSTYVTKTFSLEWMKSVDLPWSEYEISTIVEDVGRRWMDVATCVFEDPDEPGAFYSFDYEVGKTEYQEQYWWEELPDEVECFLVKEVEVTVKQWQPVKTQ
jgi:hypothetical protein